MTASDQSKKRGHCDPSTPSSSQMTSSGNGMERSCTRSHAAPLLDQIQGGAAFDLVQDLSIPFPLLVICELLGVDGSQWPRFFDWSEAVIPGEAEQTEEQRTAHQI